MPDGGEANFELETSLRRPVKLGSRGCGPRHTPTHTLVREISYAEKFSIYCRGRVGIRAPLPSRLDKLPASFLALSLRFRFSVFFTSWRRTLVAPSLALQRHRIIKMEKFCVVRDVTSSGCRGVAVEFFGRWVLRRIHLNSLFAMSRKMSRDQIDAWSSWLRSFHEFEAKI